MDKTLNEVILDDAYEILFSDKEETTNSTHDLPPLPANNVTSVFDVNYSPKEENADGVDTTSDSLIQQLQNTTILNTDHKYRIHLGTQPGYYTEGLITFTESEKLHSKVIDLLEDFLISSNVSYKLIKKDAFSNSAWGLEPYACLLLSCSNEIARGLAGIIGLALRQDAIGIYSNNNDGFSHPVFTISTSDDSLFTKTDARILMKVITKHCTCLSAQFDENGQNLEFHDYENNNDKPVLMARIQTIITRHFGIKNLFHISKSIGQSDLLEKQDYQGAINLAGFASFSKLIELTRLHDGLYSKSEST